MQASHLRRQEPRRFHRGLIAIVKIAGDDQRIDPLCKAEIHDGDECLATGVADEFGKIGVPSCTCARRDALPIGLPDFAGARGQPTSAQCRIYVFRLSRKPTPEMLR